MSSPRRKLTKIEVLTLQRKWYQKIKDLGFVDIEHENGSVNSGLPKSLRSGPHKEHTYDSVLAYSNMVTAFLNEYQFPNELDKVIWEYYSHGIYYRDIAKVINKTRSKDMQIDKDVVYRRIKKYEKLMKDMYLAV